jgi:hypothetical protein
LESENTFILRISLRMCKQAFVNTLLLCALSFSAFGQLTQADSSQYHTTENEIDLSNDFVQLPSHLYNGIEYVNYDSQIDGHQFFESPVLEEGSVRYNGILYRNVPMVYDIMKDELAIEHFYKYYKISLISERISQFSLLNHTFVRLVTNNQANIRTGFYEKLYDGQVKVLAKRSKIMDEEIVHQRVKRRFVQKDRYYVYKDKAYYEVKNKKGAIRILKDRKKEIRKFLQQHQAQFTTLEQALVGISQFYDTLPQAQ